MLKEQRIYYGSEKERSFNAWHYDYLDRARCSERWEMPLLEPCSVMPTKLIGFDYAATCDKFDRGVHFYCNDYVFERLWKRPDQLLGRLKRFECVLTPDFSIYDAMPLPMQLWQLFRARLLGQMMQDEGMNVIPSLTWNGPDSYDYCFDGLPQGGVFAVSTVGAVRREESRQVWRDGVEHAINTLEMCGLVVYGTMIDFDNRGVPVVNVPYRKWVKKDAGVLQARCG